MKKRTPKWLIVLLLGTVIAGIFMFHNYQKHEEELKRNREYEVSLVNALKNSYEGIEKIRIKNSHYNDVPGDWTCYVELKFQDGQSVGYYLSHNLGLTRNKSAVTSQEVINALERHYGETHGKVVVKYSDGNKGEQ